MEQVAGGSGRSGYNYDTEKALGKTHWKEIFGRIWL